MPNIFNDRYYKIIHGFQQPNGSFLLNNSVTEINNKLYGLAADNGSPNNYGKLYRCNFDGSEFEILYRFSGVTYGDGDQPVRNILYDNVSNKIYGVTAYGGVPVSPIYSVPTRGGGIIFSYDLTTDNYEVLYRFSGITVNNDGYSPLPTLIKVGNKLYGGTFGGGFSILPGGGGNGIIFEYDLTTNTYQVFYRLNANESEGVQVNGLTYNPNNNKIYGVAYIGGSSPGQGVLFEIDLLGNYTKLHDFSGTTYNDGDLPINELYITSNNIIYGVTQQGGTNNLGTIFSSDTAGNIGYLHSFSSTSFGGLGDGEWPQGSVTEFNNSGVLYGTAFRGSIGTYGTIFSCDTSGNFGVLHRFRYPITICDGVNPRGKLLNASNNFLYGTTYLSATIYTWINECYFSFRSSGSTQAYLYDPTGTNYRYTWGIFNSPTNTLDAPFATVNNGLYWTNQCGPFANYITESTFSYNDLNCSPVVNRTIFIPGLVGPNNFKGIAYAGTPNRLLINNAATQSVQLYDISTNNATLVNTVFTLPLTHTFDINNRLVDSLYFDLINNIFYIAFTNTFTSFDINGTILNDGQAPSGNIISMYVYNGDIYTNTDNNLIYLTEPFAPSGWTFNLIGSGPFDGPMYAIAQEQDANCVLRTTPPPPFSCVTIFSTFQDGLPTFYFYDIENPITTSSAFTASYVTYASATNGYRVWSVRAGTGGGAQYTPFIDVYDLNTGVIILSEQITIPPLTQIGGIFYVDPTHLYVLNLSTNPKEVQLWDITIPTAPVISTVFAIPPPYTNLNATYAQTSLYVDQNTNTFYIDLGNFTNGFVSFSVTPGNPIPTQLNSGAGWTDFFGLEKIISLYMYNGQLYTTTTSGFVYLTQPNGSGGWQHTQLYGPDTRSFNGLTQTLDEECMGSVPPPSLTGCVYTALTVTGCSDFVIIDVIGQDITCAHPGLITAQISGGCPDYTYTLYHPNPNTIVSQVTTSATTWTFFGLTDPGIYYVSITSCSGDTLMTLNPVIIIDNDTFFVDDYLLNNQQLCFYISGGTPPYTIFLNQTPINVPTGGTYCFNVECSETYEYIVFDSSEDAYCNGLTAVTRCTLTGPSYFGHINRTWPDGLHTFTIVNLTVNGIQYGIGNQLLVTAPNGLSSGFGLDGNTYVTNVTDWINSLIPDQFTFWNDMGVVDTPIGGTFNLVIDYLSPFGITTQYTYNSSTGWSINGGVSSTYSCTTIDSIVLPYTNNTSVSVAPCDTLLIVSTVLESYIYSYNVLQNTFTDLSPYFSQNGPAGSSNPPFPCKDIAHTATKLWVYPDSSPTYLLEYDITLSPFTASFNRVINLPAAIGAGLVALNDTTLISSSGSNIIEIDVSNTITNVGVFTIKFPMPTNRIIAGDMVITSNSLFCTYEQGNFKYVTQHLYPSGTISTDIPVNPQQLWGVFSRSGLVYVCDTNGDVYTVDTINFTLNYVQNVPLNVFGASSIINCQNVTIPQFAASNPFNLGGCIQGEVYPHPSTGPLSDELVPYAQLPQPPVSYVNLPNFNIPYQPCVNGFPGQPNLFEWFQIEFFGIIHVPISGTYTFALQSDDGAIFSMPTVPYTLDNNGQHWVYLSATSQVYLTAGDYPFQLSYYQGPRWNIALTLLWDLAGTSPLVPVPVSGFTCPTGVTECVCVFTGQTTVICGPPSVTIVGTNACCVNDGTVTIDVINGIPNYTITGTNTTTGEEIIVSSPSTPIFIDHLTAGNWVFTVLDGNGGLVTANNSITLTSVFNIDVFTGATTSTGTTICFSGTSCLSNNIAVSIGQGSQLTSIQLSPNPVLWNGNSGSISPNTLYCFTIPSGYCGTDIVNLFFTVPSPAYINTLSVSFSNSQCQSLYGTTTVTEGTWINNNPAYWFTLPNGGPRVIIYFDPVSNNWIWYNRDSGSPCSTSPDLVTWNSLINPNFPLPSECQCTRNIVTSLASIADACGIDYVTFSLPCPPFTVSGTSINPLCDQDCSGSITLTLEGGNAPYTFQLLDGLGNILVNSLGQPTTSPLINTNTYTFNNLCAGTYYPLVTDSVGSTATTTPFVLVNTFDIISNVSLITNSTGGTICFNVTGGTGSYNISIQDVGFVLPPITAIIPDGETCFDLGFSCYTWTITDPVTGCFESGNNCIPQIPFSCSTTLYSDPSCDCSGTITGGIVGGIGPYVFDLYSNGIVVDTGTVTIGYIFNMAPVTYVFTGLCSGVYTIVVTDISIPLTLTCDTITLDSQFIVGVTTSGSCSSVGQYCITVSGGTPPYSIQAVNQGDSFYTYFNQVGSDGTYCYSAACGTYDNVIIYDSSTPPCYIYTSFTINCPVDLTATTVGNPCQQTGQGSITITNIGGTPPFLYSIDGGLTFYPQNYFGGLNSGTYTIAIQDSIPCTASTQVTIYDTTTLDITASATSENCDYTSGGTITVFVNNGTPPYTYIFNGGTPTSSNYFTGLTVGTYTINVIDSLGCQGTVTVVVDTPISLSGTITTSESCAYAPSLYRYLALKVEPILNYLGNDALENEHVNYAACQGYTIYQSYGVQSIWRTLSNTATSPQGLNRPQAEARLEIFLGKVYAAGLLPVAIMGDTNDFDWIASVDATHTIKFWGIELENEFWNGSVPFATWIGYITYLRNKVDTAQFPPYNIMAYIANPTQTNWGLAEANQIVTAGIDVLQITNFTAGKPNPASGSFVNQLNLLSTAAANNNVIQKFIPLWSAEYAGNSINNFSGAYFGVTTNYTIINPSNVLTQYDIDFANVSYAFPSNLTKVGYSVYEYIFAIDPGVLPGCTNLTGPVSAFTASGLTGVNGIYTTLGTLLINANGGYPPYLYSVDGGSFQTSNYFTGLNAGTHIFVVTDSSGCTVTGVTVVEGALDIDVTTTPESCLLNSGGTLTITVGRGEPPYQYSINGGPYTNINFYSGLGPGTYTINVIDVSGCSATTTATISDPIPISVSAITTNLSCFGDNVGTILINATGGNPPYQYSIDNGVTFGGSNYYTGLGVGTYYIIVKDTFGCSATTSGTVSTAITLTVSAISSTVSACTSASTVDLTLLVNGGTPPYTFHWDPVNVNTQIVHVNDYTNIPGNYSYTGTVIDRFGCSATTVIDFSITTAATPTLGISYSGTLTCDPLSYVIFSATVIGYYDTICWSNGECGVLTITANTPGTYGYYVEVDGCYFSSTTITIDYPTSPPPIIGYDANLCICSSTEVGIINNGYTYSDLVWNNGFTGTSFTVSSCTPATYTFYLTAKDEYGCPVSSNTVTIIFSDLDIDVYTTDAICLECGTCIDGYAEVVINRGTPPYTFSWTGSNSTTNTAENLTPGTYCVSITDGAGCTESICFNISGSSVTICDFEPLKDGQGNIILNPDGTISFVVDTPPSPVARISIINFSPTAECCLRNSTTDLPLLYCDCKCYWNKPPCNSGDTILDKIILGTNGNNGIQLVNTTPKNNQSITCSYQVTFNYLFNFDCQSLYDCVQAKYSGDVLTFLSGLSAYATVEVLSGSSYVTAQVEPIWTFDLYRQPTGIYFGGQNCDLITQSIYNSLGTNCSALTENTFVAIWQTASFKIYDSLSGQTIKLGMLMEGFGCEYNILLDNIKIEEVCIVTEEEIISLPNGGCPGFELQRIVDNKKSWVYNEDTYNRDWFHLKYRDTSYIDYDERLDINTKEIDLDLNPSRAINYDIYCYALNAQNCLTISGCNNPNLVLGVQGPSIDYCSVGVPYMNDMSGNTMTGRINFFDSLGSLTTDVNQIVNPPAGGLFWDSVDYLGVDRKSYFAPITANTGTLYICQSGITAQFGFSGNTIQTYNFGSTGPLPPSVRTVFMSWPTNSGLPYLQLITPSSVPFQQGLVYLFYTLGPANNVTTPGSWINFPNVLTYSGSILSFVTSGLVVGNTYDIQFTIRVTGPPTTSIVYIAFGVEQGGNQVTLLDNITGATNNGVTTYNFTQTITGTLSQYSNFFIRIINGNGPKTYSVRFSDLIITEHCTPTTVNPSSVFTIPSGMTFNEFIDLASTELIDVTDRQSISAYPLLRYLYDKYLGLCGLDNCIVQSGQYNYTTLNNFAQLIGDYWIDLVEQFVPATTIWGGDAGGRGTRIYSNNIFDQPKFEYRNFSIGYCSDYCFQTATTSPINITICYIGTSLIKGVDTQLTQPNFNEWVNQNIMSTQPTIKNRLVSNVRICASQNSLYGGLCDCINVPEPCFISADIRLKMTEGPLTTTISLPTVTNLNAAPNQTDFMNAIYNGLTQLGYSTSANPPYNNLQWSKDTPFGCADDIIPELLVNIRYSCVTGSTVVPGSGTAFSYEPIDYNFPSVSRFNVGQVVVSGDTVYGVVKGNPLSNNDFGYLYSYDQISNTLIILKLFGVTGNNLRFPNGGLVLGTGGWLYGTTLHNNIPGVLYYDWGGLFRYNVFTGQYQILTSFSPTIGIGKITNGSRILKHTNGKLYIPIVDIGGNGSYIYELDITLPTPTGRQFYGLNYSTGEIFLSEDVANLTGLNFIIGTTNLGGTLGKGSIFRLNTDITLPLFNIIYSFGTLSTLLCENPSGPLRQSPISGSYNKFYGVTNGPITPKQTLYVFDLYQANTSTAVSLLHTFDNTTPPEGRNPEGNIIIVNNLIYGQTTTAGLSNYGNIFSYDLVSGQFNNIHQYTDGQNGASTTQSYPYLTFNTSDSYIYGVTAYGGFNKNGTLFRFAYTGTPTTYTYQTGVFTCNNLQLLTSTLPVINKITVSNTIAGTGTTSGYTTPISGISNCITSVSAVTVIVTACTNTFAGVDYRVLHNFTGGTDGQYPGRAQKLIQASNGKLYGMTITGGYINACSQTGFPISRYGGLIYECSTTGVYNVIHYFTGRTSGGVNPKAGLVMDSLGYFYGSTGDPGIANNSGCTSTIFRTTTLGNYTTLHDFGCLGYSTGLIIASNGILYGLVSAEVNCGTLISNNSAGIYSCDTSGNYGKIFSFPGGFGGEGLLMEASDGLLYGTIGQRFFKIGKNGLGYTVIRTFLGGTTDLSISNLDQLTEVNGVLYGVGQLGGSAANNGGIFKYDIVTGQYNIVYTFPNPTIEGKNPSGSLYLRSDGFLYGTNGSGGANNWGTIFKFDYNNNTVQPLYSFDVTTGGQPVGGVIEGVDGRLYGLAYQGGTNNRGVIYTFGEVYSCTTVTSAVTQYAVTTQQGTGNCAGYVNNPGVEVIVEDLSSLITNPCVPPPIITQCYTVFATHIDNDVWFDGWVTVITGATVTNNTGVPVTVIPNVL